MDDESKLEEWADRNKGAISPHAYKELEALLEETKVDRVRTSFKQKIYKVLKWLGILGAGAVITGGAIYVSKQAADAFPQAVKVAAEREMNERMEMIKASFQELQNASGTFLLKLLDFMMAVKNKATSWEGLSSMAVSLWDGVWSDVKEAALEGESSPDKLMRSMSQIVSSDPKLLSIWTGVEQAYTDLKEKKAQLEKVGIQIQSVDDQDAREFFEDYKNEFWAEMRREGLRLGPTPSGPTTSGSATSAPEPESQEEKGRF